MYKIITVIKSLIISLVNKYNNNIEPSGSQVNSDSSTHNFGGLDMGLLYSSFKYAKKEDIDENYPLLIQALENRNILSRDMIIYCLATVESENPWWKPIAERPSKWSTKSRKKPYDFSNYANRYGNNGYADAKKFKGRGLIQITFKANYARMDEALGLNGALLTNPDLAMEPKIATQIFAQYMKDRISRILPALKNRDYIELRKIVNGGTHGLERFKNKFLELDQSFPK